LENVVTWIGEDFVIDIFFNGSSQSALKIEEVPSPLDTGGSFDDNTLGFFFNISSTTEDYLNITMSYTFEYESEKIVAEFDLDTLGFAEVIQGIPVEMEGGQLDFENATLLIDMGSMEVSFNRTYTIVGDYDILPPESPFNITTYYEGDEDMDVSFTEVPEAVGYYIFITKTEVFDVSDETPYTDEPIEGSPVLLLFSMEEGDIRYLSIAPMDIAGNVNYNVFPKKIMIEIPNHPPVAIIDPMMGNYYVDEVIFFTCRGTYDLDPKDVLSYKWDLDGDNKIDSEVETPTFKYDYPAKYRIKLIVEDEIGSASTAILNLTISEGISAPEERNPMKDWFLGLDLITLIIILLVIIVVSILIISLIISVVISRKRHTPSGKPSTPGRYVSFINIKTKREKEGITEESEEDFPLVVQPYRPISLGEPMWKKVLPIVKAPMRKFSKELKRKEPKENKSGMNRTLVCGNCKEILIVDIVIKDDREGKKSMDRQQISCPVCKTSGTIYI